MNQMKLIFLHGAPAVGKLTVARELARAHGLSSVSQSSDGGFGQFAFSFRQRTIHSFCANRFGWQRLLKRHETTSR